MDDLEERFRRLVTSEAFSPPPVEDVRSARARRRRANRFGAAAAAVVLLTSIAVTAVRLSPRSHTDISAGAPPGANLPTTSHQMEWDCVAVTLWERLERDKQELRDGKLDPVPISAIVVGRIGPEINRTTTPNTRVWLARETRTSSFDTWRVLHPFGSSASPTAVASLRTWRTDVPGTSPPCDNMRWIEAKEGQVVVSYVHDDAPLNRGWSLGSHADDLFFVVRRDGSPPRSSSELDDSVRVETADHETACRHHDTCSLAEFQQEIDELMPRG